jgi:hypothetical protein
VTVIVYEQGEILEAYQRTRKKNPMLEDSTVLLYSKLLELEVNLARNFGRNTFSMLRARLVLCLLG